MQPNPDTEHASTKTLVRAQSRPAERGTSAPGSGLRLERRVDGKLWLHRDGASMAVEVVRCFPWSRPDRMLSLRDEAGVEQAFIAELAELDNRSRATLRASLERSAFVLEIVRVLGVEEDFELRSFTVETEQGRRRFQTALDAWPRELESGALIIEDVYGDLYRVRSPQALDAESRKHLGAFLD